MLLTFSLTPIRGSFLSIFQVIIGVSQKPPAHKKERLLAVYNSLARLDDSLDSLDLFGMDAELIENQLPAVLDCIINANLIPD